MGEEISKHGCEMRRVWRIISDMKIYIFFIFI